MTTSRFYSTCVVIDLDTLQLISRDMVPYSGPWDLLDAAPTADAPPSDAGPSDDIGSDAGPVPDATGDSGELPGGDEPDIQADTDAPAEGDETQPTEGDETQPEPGQPTGQPKPTQQELAADAKLKAVYRENYGQVKEILKNNPALRPAFFKAAEFNEIFVTPDDAKQAKDWATQLYNFDRLYYGDEGGKRQFLQSLYENSLEGDGSSPHYDQLASMFVGDGLSNLARLVQSGDQSISRAFSDLGLNGKQAMVAVQAVATMLGLGLKGVSFASSPAASRANAPGTMSEREQYLANQVAELNEQLSGMKTSSLAQTERNFYDGIQATFNSSLAADIDKRLEPATALRSQKPGFQNWVKSEVINRTKAAVKSDEFFASQMEAMSRSGNRGPEHQHQLVAALEQRARQFLPDVLREVLQEAGIAIQQKTNAARNQAGTPHREPATSGTPGRLSKPGTASPNKGKPNETYEQFSRRVLELE